MIDSAKVTAWYRDNARDLPWRRPGTTPWGILLSEVMSHQTPVARVAPIWEEWIARWPTPADLAAAPTDAVLRAWGTLGYPRRALRLKECAQTLVDGQRDPSKGWTGQPASEQTCTKNWPASEPTCNK